MSFSTPPLMLYFPYSTHTGALTNTYRLTAYDILTTILRIVVDSELMNYPLKATYVLVDSEIML